MSEPPSSSDSKATSLQAHHRLDPRFLVLCRCVKHRCRNTPPHTGSKRRQQNHSSFSIPANDTWAGLDYGPEAETTEPSTLLSSPISISPTKEFWSFVEIRCNRVETVLITPHTCEQGKAFMVDHHPHPQQSGTQVSHAGLLRLHGVGRFQPSSGRDRNNDETV